MPKPIPKPSRAEDVLATAAARPSAGQGVLGRSGRPRFVTRIRAGPAQDVGAEHIPARHHHPGRVTSGRIIATGNVLPR